MSLPILISIIPTILFASLTIYFSIKEEKLKKLLQQKETNYKQHLYETTILRQIQDRIGYSLDVEKVIDVITGSLDNLFQYSTVSSLTIKNDKLIFKTHIQKPVSTSFILQLKQSMSNSLAAILNHPLPTLIDENITGLAVEEASLAKPESFFHIPLIINEQIVGLISIASTQPNLYKEQEMTILYKITNVASGALSKLQNVLEIEKGKLTAMIASLQDGVFMVDINSQVTVINKQSLNLLHIQKDHPSIIDVLSSLPNTYNFGEKIQLAITQNQTVEQKNLQFNDKTYDIIINPVLDTTTQTQPKVIGAAVIFHDITLEKSLAQMKEDFTNIIVHELRSPLTAIKSSTELLINETTLKEDERAKLLKLVHTQSNRLLDQVSLILDAAKLEAGLFTINKTPGDLKKLIQERLDIFQPQAQNKNITLKTNLDPTLPVFDFDPIHMTQILNNLLSNSLKFTPPGGTITISTQYQTKNKENTAYPLSPIPYPLVTLSVSDTGAGIPKEKQNQLFSKFTQLSSNNGPTIGTGLGLYIVKGITEAHGGQVTLQSEPNQGTTITLTFPINPTTINTLPTSTYANLTPLPTQHTIN